MQQLWWLNLVRGIVAVLIGALALMWPQSVLPFFVNFLAIYWLSSGLVGLQAGLLIHQKKGPWLASNLLDIGIGIALLLRPVYVQAFSLQLSLTILGLLALCSGLIHIVWSYKITPEAHEQAVSIFILGAFEVVLGTLLIFLNVLGSWSKLFIGGWLLLGGTLLILQALQMRRASVTHSS